MLRRRKENFIRLKCTLSLIIFWEEAVKPVAKANSLSRNLFEYEYKPVRNAGNYGN
jgi:hypothetical protein